MSKDHYGNDVVTVKIPRFILDEVRSNFHISDDVYNRDVINALLLYSMDLTDIKLNYYLNHFNISKATYNQIVKVNGESSNLDIESDISDIKTQLNQLNGLTQLDKDMNIANVFLKEIILMNRLIFDKTFMGDVTDEKLNDILSKERIENLKKYTKSKASNKKK